MRQSSCDSAVIDSNSNCGPIKGLGILGMGLGMVGSGSNDSTLGLDADTTPLAGPAKVKVKFQTCWDTLRRHQETLRVRPRSSELRVASMDRSWKCGSLNVGLFQFKFQATQSQLMDGALAHVAGEHAHPRQIHLWRGMSLHKCRAVLIVYVCPPRCQAFARLLAREDSQQDHAGFAFAARVAVDIWSSLAAIGTVIAGTCFGVPRECCHLLAGSRTEFTNQAIHRACRSHEASSSRQTNWKVRVIKSMIET
eukprot:656502-Amphidinium_carterae.1